MIYRCVSLGSVELAGISAGTAYVFNSVTLLLVTCAAPMMRMFGKTPGAQGLSSMGTMMWTSLLWPLSLVPLHRLNHRLLKGNHWGYAGLLLGTGVLIALVVLMFTSSSAAS